MAEQIVERFSPDDRRDVASAGMDLSEKTRSGSFLQQDDKLLFSRNISGDVEIMGINQALKIYPEVKDYYGKAFRYLEREFPPDTEGGYFVRAKKGKTVELPVQACLFLKAQKFQQKVHNIIIVEEGAKVNLITGCTAAQSAHEGFHLGISEFFIQKGGQLNFTMIHSWREDVSVKPISIALVEEGSVFISNYICLRPVREITMYPTAVLLGDGGRASFNSLLLAHPDASQDIGSRVILKAPNTSAEIISRAVSLGGKIIARGHLAAESPEVRAHLECRGLVVSERGYIQAIPELATKFREVDLSHEAAIGKISKEEIEYLCSRGIPRDEAQSIIIRGFMDVEILGLPDILKKEIEELESKMLRDSL